MVKRSYAIVCDETAAATFLGKVWMLKQTSPPFDPSAKGGNYTAPQQDGPVLAHPIRDAGSQGVSTGVG